HRQHGANNRFTHDVLESPLGVLAKCHDFSASQDRWLKSLYGRHNNGAVKQLANRGKLRHSVLAIVVPARGHPAQEWSPGPIIGCSCQDISGHAQVNRTALDQALPMVRSGIVRELELGKPRADRMGLTAVLALDLQTWHAPHQRKRRNRKSWRLQVRFVM